MTIRFFPGSAVCFYFKVAFVLCIVCAAVIISRCMFYRETTQCKQFVCITLQFQTYHFVLWILKKRTTKKEEKKKKEKKREKKEEKETLNRCNCNTILSNYVFQCISLWLRRIMKLRNLYAIISLYIYIFVKNLRKNPDIFFVRYIPFYIFHFKGPSRVYI